MFRNNILLSNYSSYKIGGPAKYFYQAKTAEDLIAALKRWQAVEERECIDTCRSHRVLPNHAHIFILGGGTNLIFNDPGFPGLVLQPSLLKLELTKDGIKAEAGVLMSDLLNFAADNSLSGLEWAGGLPGTLGGAIRGNAGAFGGEIKDCIQEVVSLKISGPQSGIIRRSNQECRFGYRNSIFKERDGEEIIISAQLVLKQGDKHKIFQAMEEKIQYRKEKHPMEYPNVGSIFKNVALAQINGKARSLLEKLDPQFPVKDDPFPVVPTAYLIAQAGLKGLSYGGARVSEKHPNFIVNFNNAKASDVKKLIGLVKTKVKDKFNIQLEEEVIIL